jgi:hypothetical protein
MLTPGRALGGRYMKTFCKKGGTAQVTGTQMAGLDDKGNEVTQNLLPDEGSGSREMDLVGARLRKSLSVIFFLLEKSRSS